MGKSLLNKSSQSKGNGETGSYSNTIGCGQHGVGHWRGGIAIEVVDGGILALVHPTPKEESGGGWSSNHGNANWTVKRNVSRHPEGEWDDFIGVWMNGGPNNTSRFVQKAIVVCSFGRGLLLL
jgi:hypothetical protein